MASNRAVVSCPAAKRNVALRTTDITSGVEPSGYLASAMSVITSWRGSRRRSSMYSAKYPSSHSSALSPMLLLAAELAGRAAQEAEPLAEPLVVGLGYAEDVGDDQQGERLGVGGDELAATEVQELVELPIREPPHEVLVLPEAERGEQAHEQRPLSSVIGRIHRHHVLVHRELVAIRVDDLADVVADEWHRERGERPDHGVARGERVRVAVDVAGLFQAGDGHHAVMRERRHRALRAQVLEVRVRVLQQRRVGEEIDLVEVGHQMYIPPLTPMICPVM